MRRIRGAALGLALRLLAGISGLTGTLRFYGTLRFAGQSGCRGLRRLLVALAVPLA